jgi:predicted nucleic acid-binding protein
MTSHAVRANCLDASSLLKVYIEEDGSDIIRKYMNDEATCYTTPFCYYETLTLLKVNWLYRKIITKKEYLKKTLELTAWFSSVSRRVRDIDIKDREIFKHVQDIAERNNIDLSDAFQIISVKNGYYSNMSNDSKTILVTADKDLANAARTEGLKSWNFMKEVVPS